MKRIMVVFAFCFVLFTGCGLGNEADIYGDETAGETYVDETQDDAAQEDMFSTINDWILGTDYGVIAVDFDGNTFYVEMPKEKRAELADYERSDIGKALRDIGNTFGFADCEVMFADKAIVADGEAVGSENSEAGQSPGTADFPQAGERINLIFIHHSVGENWLNDGLCEMLNEKGIHVADTYYGWSDMGDHTDTEDWPNWFNDRVMPSVYSKIDTETAHNTIGAGSGENTVIMFKSCFPNSDVGNSIDDEKAIYESLLEYFSQHPNKMFVLITPPPKQHISHPKKTRELADYLVDKNGWLENYAGNNVYVFDLYNVLTSPDNHHMLVNGVEEHIVASPNNTLYYDSGGDDHPSAQGNIKAAEEFVPLLLYWYDQFSQ